MAKYYNPLLTDRQNELMSIALTASLDYYYMKNKTPWYKRLGRFRRSSGNVVLKSTISSLRSLVKELEKLS